MGVQKQIAKIYNLMDKVTTNIPADKTKSEIFNMLGTNSRRVEATVEDVSLSSYGGLLLLREVDNSLGLSKAISTAIKDKRQQGKVKHTVYQMVLARLLLMSLGYDDCNDCFLVKNEPLFVMALCESLELESMPTQPSMSRFENMVDDEDLANIEEVLLNVFISSYETAPVKIILDFDETNTDCYGAQEGTLFNAYYDEYCYMPLLVFEDISGKFVCARLNPGRPSKRTDQAELMRRLVLRLRQVWPDTKIIVRADSAFCSHDFMDWVTESGDNRLQFITGLCPNNRLKEHTVVRRLIAKAFEWKKIHPGTPGKFYGSFRYAAETWGHQQRVVVKVEVTRLAQSDLNIRFVVTNIGGDANITFGLDRDSYGDITAMHIYEEHYCRRGQAELYIGQFKNAASGNRLFCHAMRANCFRLLMSAAVYVLLYAVREKLLKDTELRNATLLSIREKLLMCAVFVERMKTKFKLRLSSRHPLAHVFRDCLRQCCDGRLLAA